MKSYIAHHKSLMTVLCVTSLTQQPQHIEYTCMVSMEKDIAVYNVGNVLTLQSSKVDT